MKKDLQELPKLRDSISFIYVEHASIDQENLSIVAHRADGNIPIPVSATTCLMLGPGTSVTHAAIKTMGENGCMAVWCGENVTHFYASGAGETYSARNLLRQAELCMNPDTHLEVAKRMYLRRFGSITRDDYTLQQLRGMEGIRVREAYKLASKATGVKWTARSYKQENWDDADPVNRALSQANAILYAVVQASLYSLGYSTALGFVHTGKQLSFVYDIADLYKAEVTIPAAFQAVKMAHADPLEAVVRRCCRNRLEQAKLLKRIPEDIEWIFRINDTENQQPDRVGTLWDQDGIMSGGKNYGDDMPW